jgi:uncharacterized protein YqfA (UPF0365 family)
MAAAVVLVARPRDASAATTDRRGFLEALKSELPKAIAESLASGKLNVMDYYKLKNITADTEMRQSIAGTSTTGPTNPTRSQTN